MKRFRTPAAVIAIWLISAGAAKAQGQYVPPARPTFSPYLNLLRNDSSPALNYYGLVRPEQRALKAQAAFGQALQQTNQAIEEGIKGADPNIPATGHAAMFNNTMQYFGGSGGSGSRPQVFGGGRPQPLNGRGGGLRR